MDQLDLSSFCKTKAQANDFSARLAAIAEKVYQTDFNLEKSLNEQLGLRKKDQFLTLLRESKIAVEKGSDLKAFLDKLQQDVLSLPVLSITIAFEPTEQTLKAISEWFLLNVHKQILLDVTVDPLLVGGATIAFKGKFLDFSVKPIFEKVLSESMSHMTSAAIPEAKQTPPPVAQIHQSIEHITIGH